ncbi:hypothetical protein BCV69DRAFT_267217 [Microstroma glucosiphilum]|uniref:Lariat debranching enzyme C-terminal domain-containing protein n=1 Tax=Pseudomicrostroma glucosiphilum TaxID=1684307 RepID=A0A316UE07_9BASI|nr:hypothetical protein BCV69DRAFT_267217 [Pseudomicrostroma glucosiphilum]PWN23449.1 hypothetical protein BCV69DRAFT_267217 [Pseudomicrostroma glucosiphilum]
MKIAVEGCSHGELDNIYASILKAEEQGNFKTDVLLLCGDFQALRNVADLECLAVPQKYRELGGFHRYYSGEKVAPLLTIVIGGNHEASNYMWELYHGGWLAPNIYFLGEAGVIDVGGVIIAGASGIYKSHDYHRGRYEQMPYDKSSIRSVYHTRVYDIWRLKLLASSAASRPDVVLSHDWPNTIEQYGDTAKLISRKPFFKDEIQSSTLGSPPLLELMRCLRPKYWFSAHLHVKFAAIFEHRQGSGGAHQSSGQSGGSSDPDMTLASAGVVSDPSSENPEAIDLDFDDEEDAEQSTKSAGEDVVKANVNPDELAIDEDEVAGIDEDPPHDHGHGSEAQTAGMSHLDSASPVGETRFLALSKCLPSQDFLQFLDIHPRESDDRSNGSTAEASSSSERTFPPLRFVPRWLAVLRATNHLLSMTRQQPHLPDPSDAALLERIEQEEVWVRSDLQSQAGEDSLAIGRIQQFAHTAPTASSPLGGQRGPPPWYTNPQTEALTKWLCIENKINPPPINGPPGPNLGPPIRFGGPSEGVSTPTQPTMTPADEEAEIKRIEAAAAQASRARKRFKSDEEKPTEAEPLRLDEDESVDARWKEGTG